MVELYDGNMNHPLAAVANLIIGGENAAQGRAVELGTRKLKAFRERVGDHRSRHRRQAEMSAYNSLTYTALDLWFLVSTLRCLCVEALPETECSTEIMVWLRSVERALERLGCAPEYLLLAASMMKERSAWLQHGSASNLNCATGRYQALLEGVLGVEFDPGGLTVMPLVLPLRRAEVSGIHHLGTRWNVKVRQGGAWLKALRVDGEVEEGCLKVPKRHHDKGEHELELSYGEEKPGPHFVELSNAEVLHVESTSVGVEVTVNALGQGDLEYSEPANWSLSLDGKHVASARSELGDRWWASLSIFGQHTLLISPRK